MKEEVKSIEEELRRVNYEYKKLLEDSKETDRAKNEFLANISHELRTPLNIIMGVLHLLTLFQKQECINYNDLERHIKMMRQNCYRLLRLINNLVDISKMDAGFFRIKKKRCDIIKTVEDITLSVARYAESKGLSLVFDTDAEEKEIYCDQDQIERIILNLLSNSMKFTHSGGSITVNMESTEDYVKTIVKDTGIGIPQGQLSTIFDRFIQVNNGEGGSGIGLSLVKSLVEMHDGEIEVKSEVDQGTEFIVTLHVDNNSLLHEEPVEMERTNNYDNIRIEFSDIYPD